MDILEETDDIPNLNVNILHPEDGNETETSSDGSDDEYVADMNHLPRGVLNQFCKNVPNA